MLITPVDRRHPTVCWMNITISLLVVGLCLCGMCSPAAVQHSVVVNARSNNQLTAATTQAEGGNGPTPPAEKQVKRFDVMKVEFHRVETPFMIGLWIFCSSLAKIGFHMAPRLNQIFPESCLLIAVGVIIGILLYLFSSVRISPLTPDTFFLYMLPPIILDAGYFMPNRLFFDHLGTILWYAVIGTLFNTLTIGVSLWGVGQTGLFGCDTPLLEMLLFAALISAVDPVAVLAVFEEIHVNEILYIVVFGESLLNDAVTVVLYHMFEAYTEMGPANILYSDLISGMLSFFVVGVGGTFIGVMWGFLTGLVTRFTNQVRVIEPIFIFIMAYLAYLNAEIFHMSGILAITFCGITMKNYVEANISHKSHTTIKYAMKMLSSSSETIIFMFLGVATVSDGHIWNTWFVVLTILFCSVFRAIGVILLTAVVNEFRLYKLTKVDKFVMSYGGLRGAVAFALVLLIDPKHVKLQPMFVTTTIAVIYFTVFFQGITIKPLVKILNVKTGEKRKPTMNERIHEKMIDHTMTGIEDVVGHHGNHHLRDKFKRFDTRFIRPYLIRDHQGAEPKILETYSKLAMRDAIDYMRRNASTIGNISGTESMSAIFRNYTTGNLNGSYSQLDSSTWNIDLQELEYNPSKKDLTDAKIHHLLAEELVQPYRRHRRLSYSRHAVDDRDLSTQVNYRMHMNIRRLVGERRHHHKRSKRVKDGKNHVSFPGIQNGSAKQFTHDYLEEMLQESEKDLQRDGRDDWENGITFTAHPSPGCRQRVYRDCHDGGDDDDDDDDDGPRDDGVIAGSKDCNDEAEDAEGDDVYSHTLGIQLTRKLGKSRCSTGSTKTSLISQLATLPGFNPRRARLVKQFSRSGDRPSSIEYVDVPTVAETSLPWRRSDDDNGQQQPLNGAKKMSRDSNASDDTRVTTPTALETMLPWKRDDDGEMSTGPVKQCEFPPWCTNKEYLAYNSPSATFLGGVEPSPRSVIGLFRRESGAGGAGDMAIHQHHHPQQHQSCMHLESPDPHEEDDEDDEHSSVLLIEEGAALLGNRDPRKGSILELSSPTSQSRARDDDYLVGASASGSTPSLGDRWSVSPRGFGPRRQSSLPITTSIESFTSSISDISPHQHHRP